jgi:RNA polymerase sigma-B factor
VCEADDLRAYRHGGQREPRDRLIAAYLPLAYSVARRFDRGRVPLDDLKQVAAIGLIKAIERFDPERGVAFSSFAVPTITGEILRHLRDHSWTVRPPRDIQERALRLQRERDVLALQLRRSPTAAELGERLECSVEEVLEAAEAMHALESDSLDADGADGLDDVTLADRIAVDENGYAAAEAAADVDALLWVLSDRERLLLRLRFRDDLTQAEIGRRLGCSQMHVSRMLRSVLTRLTEAAATQDSVRA